MKENRFYLARTKYNKNGFQGAVTVSENTGVSRSTIDALESDSSKRAVSYLTVAKLAQYYGVPMDYLAGITGSHSVNSSVRSICDYTGLSETTVEKLHSLHDKTGIVRIVFEELVDDPSTDISPIESAIMGIIKSAKAHNDYFDGMDALREYRKKNGYDPDREPKGIDASQSVYDKEIGAYIMSPGEVATFFLTEAESRVTGKISTLFESIRDAVAKKTKGMSIDEMCNSFYLSPWSESEEDSYEL